MIPIPQFTYRHGTDTRAMRRKRSLLRTSAVFRLTLALALALAGPLWAAILGWALV